MIESSVALLCRGPSLRHIKDIPEVEEYVIVNGFSDELQLDFIKEVLQYKPITHVLSLGALKMSYTYGVSVFQAMLNKNNYKDFNIRKIVLPYIKECLPNDHNNPILYNIKNKDDEIIPVQGLSDSHKPHMTTEYKRYSYTYPTCGMDALGYCTLEMNKKNIFIIGMDMWEKPGYMSEISVPDKAVRRGDGPGEYKLLKELLPKFLNHFSDKKFSFYTVANFQPNLDNVSVIKVEVD
ncbi:hypothetical protein CMI47_09770 [Candidatus Pacearchaeota archaeon]|nr:hypothetical protein [Candidatus Pacearchaeota archaeon]